MTQNTVAASFGTFVQSLAAIGATLATAILNVFYSFLALGQAILSAAGHLGQSVFKLGLDLCQDIIGFAVANFFLLLMLAGGYYWYTQKQGTRSRSPSASMKAKSKR